MRSSGQQIPSVSMLSFSGCYNGDVRATLKGSVLFLTQVLNLFPEAYYLGLLPDVIFPSFVEETTSETLEKNELQPADLNSVHIVARKDCQIA